MAIGTGTPSTIVPTTPVFDVLGHRGWGFNFALAINKNGSAVGVTRLGFISSSNFSSPKDWDDPLFALLFVTRFLLFPSQCSHREGGNE
jgi:hypothetical protein